MGRLRDARHDRGWSVPQLIAALRACANRLERTLPSDSSLKTEISRHENQHIKPEEDWRQLYRTVYGRSDEELGFEPTAPAPAPETDDLATYLLAARRVDPQLVRAMQQQVDHVRLLDRRVGAPSLIEQTRAQITTLNELMTYSLKPSVREGLAGILADAGALAGWQALDVGSIGAAWQHYETAKTAARESRSDTLLAHAIGEQAYALLDLDRPHDGVTLIEEAHRVATRAPSLLRSWLHAAAAELHAATSPTRPGMGHDRACRRELEQAERTLPAGTPGPSMPYLSLNATHLARWRGHCLARLGDTAAIDDLYRALDDMDSSFTRAEAGLRCDLAHALATHGELDEARVQRQRAQQLANQVGSLRQRRRISRLRLVA